MVILTVSCNKDWIVCPVFVSIKRSCTSGNYVVLLWNESESQHIEHSINYTPSTVTYLCEEIVTQPSE